MTHEEKSFCGPGVRVIVVANEKGGSGKSTIAMNIAIALMRAGNSVGSVDLDTRQRSFTHYIDNRLVWSRERDKLLPTPEHVCFDEDKTLDQDAARAELERTLEELATRHRYILIDTAGHDHFLNRLALGKADTLVTPLNDSFVDLDVLAAIEPHTLQVTGVSHYAGIVEDARRARIAQGLPDIDWIVLRNRLSMLTTRNKRLVGEVLGGLSQRLGFRCVEGLAERVVFREFYLRGLTAFDDLNEKTLGTRPTMSHVAAQLEVQHLLRAMANFGESATAAETVSPAGTIAEERAA